MILLAGSTPTVAARAFRRGLCAKKGTPSRVDLCSLGSQVWPSRVWIPGSRRSLELGV